MHQLWMTLIGIVAGIALLWFGLVITLIVCRPTGLNATEVLAILPHTIVLIRRLAADPGLPRGVRVRLVLLLVYLILPIDLIPDFIPIIGYADDAIIVALALRSVTRSAGALAIDKHWPGTPGGLNTIKRFAGINPGADT